MKARQLRTAEHIAKDREIGVRVRARRMMLKMSQEKLGDALGITFQQVQKYEKGANRISGSRLAQMATVLQTTPAFFFGDSDGKTDPATALFVEMVNRKDCLRLVMAFDKIEQQAIRMAVVRLIERMAGVADAEP